MTAPTFIKLPYPVGGIDERVMELDPARPTARYLDNINIVRGMLESRRGKKIIKATTTGNIISNAIVHYDEDVLNNQMLYMCQNASTYTLRYNDIADVSTETQITTLTSASSLSAARISTLGGNYTVIATGSSAPGIWNGSTFTLYTQDTGTYAITGTDKATVCSSAITSVAVHSGHIFLFNKDSTKFYYLALSSLAGAVSTIDSGMFVRSRGIIGGGVFVATQGTDKSMQGFAVIGDNGEVAIYTGTDPSTISTWKLEGEVIIPGKPIGHRAIVSTGRDMLVLTDTGLYSVAALCTGNKLSLSAPITELLAANSVTGMELIYDSHKERVIINVPVTASAISITQFVYHLDSKTWTTWSGNQATTIAASGSTLMCAVGKTIWKLDDEYLDETSSGVYADIVSKLEWSPSMYGNSGKKRWIKASPQFRAYGTIAISIGMISDFETQDRLASAGSWSGLNLSWDTLSTVTWGQWAAMGWASDELSPLSWKGLTGTGYAGALTMTTSTAMSPIKFVACNLVMEHTAQKL